MIKNKEHLGIIFAFSSSILWGTFLVLINFGVKSIPPLLFAASSSIVAAAFCFFICLSKRTLKELKNRQSYFPLLMITLCIIIIPYILLFLGAEKTSGTNTSILTLSEIAFTLIFTHFIGEKTTVVKIIGALGIALGAFFILFNGKLHIQIGDLMIIFSTITYPLGNFYAKKALNYLSPEIPIFIRSLFGGFFLLLLSFILERDIGIIPTWQHNWLLIIISGIIFLGLGKIVAYKAIQHLDISKSVSLFMTFPLFSLIILIFFFQEDISIYQWLGIVIMMVGVFFSVKRKSIDKSLTKYA